jgi:hypothetical protein
MTEATQTPHDALVTAYEAYIAESDKFTNKGVKAAGTRARKALQELTKAAKARRVEIQDIKNAEKA